MPDVVEVLSFPVALMRAAGPPYHVTYSAAAFKKLADIIESVPFEVVPAPPAPGKE
jgi:hypothetical protein